MRKSREITIRARELRAHATKEEQKLWYRLRELKRLGYHFRRQAPFGIYVLDFVEHGAKLVIELDGSQHGMAEQARRDTARDAFPQSRGYAVLRFWNYELKEDFEAVTEAIARELRARYPHPKNASHFSTSPQGGG